MDQSKKTMRHFYCRDVLWDTFEQMANDFDCSIDYLINEAMRYYARSKNYAPSTERPGATPGDSRPPPPRGQRPPPRQPRRGPGGPPPPPGRSRRQPTGRSLRTPTAEPAQPAPAPTLFLVFNNKKIPIDKDQFIIGRGSKTSDLAIKDGNISRKHAAVIRRNGVYYIKDLGSTNGIDYKGMRIDNKRIDEGDIFHICDYELKFSYRG